MDRLALDQTGVSARVGEPITRVNDWLHARRAVSEDKQQRILAAIERGAPTVASMLADYERDVLSRLGKLRSDLTTLTALEQPLTGPDAAALYSKALDVADPKRLQEAASRPPARKRK